jgi:hypothetical protein
MTTEALTPRYVAVTRNTPPALFVLVSKPRLSIVASSELSKLQTGSTDSPDGSARAVSCSVFGVRPVTSNVVEPGSILRLAGTTSWPLPPASREYTAAPPAPDAPLAAAPLSGSELPVPESVLSGWPAAPSPAMFAGPRAFDPLQPPTSAAAAARQSHVLREDNQISGGNTTTRETEPQHQCIFAGATVKPSYSAPLTAALTLESYQTLRVRRGGAADVQNSHRQRD